MSIELDQLLARFAQPNDLIDAVSRQNMLGGDRAAAAEFVDAGRLVGFERGDALVTQGQFDRTAYMILAGSVSLSINNCLLPYGRQAGDIVGEISAVNPRIARSATVEALGPVAALEVDHTELRRIGDKFVEIWRLLAVELTQKLEQRNVLIDTSNAVPYVFIICSKEALDIAEELRLGLSQKKIADCVIWSDDQIFPPGNYPLDDLRQQVAQADFGIAIAQPDDIRRSRGRQSSVPRDNVIYELGFFTSVLGRDRTLLLIPRDERVELPSDFKGLTPVLYSDDQSRVDLSTALGPTVRQIVKVIEKKGVRSKLEPPK